MSKPNGEFENFLDSCSPQKNGSWIGESDNFLPLPFAPSLRKKYPHMQQVHFDLDGSMTGVAQELGIPSVPLQEWGPALRFSAPSSLIKKFKELIPPHRKPFTLYGSGDFHHLSALFSEPQSEKISILSFDNHPDWDIRPPRWGCGGWINRALESSLVEVAMVWGCGNFELRWPHRLFANRAALQTKRLQVYYWKERYGNAPLPYGEGINRSDWRQRFTESLRLWSGRSVYLTIDMDCLATSEVTTNWEQGLFAVSDLTWAIEEIRSHTRLIGGDLCGGYSSQQYARWGQRLIATLDHPKLDPEIEKKAAAQNNQTVRALWSSLTTECHH